MERADRDALLAQLAEHPAWAALREVLAPALSFKAIDFTDPQWQGRLTYQHGQSELAVQLIRTVEKAAEAMRVQRQKIGAV
jgi:hypothetical protein